MGGTGASAAINAWLADPTDWDGVVRYGPAVATESTLRLLGNLAGKRVLLLGVGAGQLMAETAATGAKVIGVEPNPAFVAAARERCLEQGLIVEVYQAELAELAFVRADTIDIAVSVLSLAAVADLARVFRQLHRVLRPDGPLVCSLPHPALALASDGRYGGEAPLAWSAHHTSGTQHPHTLEAVFTALSRAGFRLDHLSELWVEPGRALGSTKPTPAAQAPSVLVVRARKTGASPASS